MTSTVNTPVTPPGRGTGWVVATDASAAQAVEATGPVNGPPSWTWRQRRQPRDGLVRRAFAERDDAEAAVSALRRAGHHVELIEPLDPAPRSTGVRIPPDVWAAAGQALDGQQGQRRVTVTLAPGTSRSAAVIAFLRAVAAQSATQVSAEGER